MLLKSSGSGKQPVIKKRRLLFFAVLLCLLASVSGSADESAALPVMKLYQFDIGCADAYLITAGNTVVLIDCGADTDAGNRTPDKVLEHLDSVGLDHVDAYFVTHYHSDHALNIKPLMEKYGTGRTIVYGPSEELPERFLPLQNARYKQLKDGDTLRIGDFSVVCVGPPKVEGNGETNRDSLNFVIKYGDRRFLFTGDYADPSLYETHPNEIRDIDVLKFPHHGLKPICIFPKTIAVIKPKIVLVPSRDCSAAREWLENNEIKADVYDVNKGNVIITSDGKTIMVETEK